MSLARGLAKTALVIGLIGGPVTACVGVVEGMAVGLASAGGDCGDGCTKNHATLEDEAESLIAVGLICGAVLVLGGAFVLRVVPRIEPARSPPAPLPAAKLVDTSGKS